MPAIGTVIVLPQDDHGQQEQQQQLLQQQQQQATPADSSTNTNTSNAAAAATKLCETSSSPSSLLLKDVDSLVQEIKENLKLGHGHGFRLKAASSRGASASCSHLGQYRGGGHSRKQQRASPYQVPPTSRAACDAQGQPQQQPQPGQPSQLRRWNHRRRYPSTCAGGGGNGKGVDPDDPFLMLQELISDGSLIKEAVRRLQLGLTPKYSTAGMECPGSGGGDGGDYDSEPEECQAYADAGIFCAAAAEVGGRV